MIVAPSVKIMPMQQFLDRGESVQIVAPSGFGKSRFAKSLAGLLVDPNILQSPAEMLEFIKTSSERKLIILDSFDHLLSTEYQPLFKYLKGLRDQYKYKLAYVVLTHKLIGPENQKLLGDFYELATEHIEYLPVLKPSEYDYFGWQPTTSQVVEVEELSGGIPTLVKICVFAMRDKTNLNSNPKLEAAITEMLADSPDHPAYKNSSLVQNYLHNLKNTQLSASETRLLNLLLKNKGQIVSKDQICKEIYPDVKNYLGITDHAIDQLMHRLRTKVKNKYTLSTRRGLGYCLS